MRAASSVALALAPALAGLCPALAAAPAAAAPATCDKPVYLTFDTGHMGVAPLIADVLKRHQVKVTFFLANERTRTDGSSLDDEWAPWWKARAAEGHAFGSHTWDHLVWQADTAAGLRLRPTAGPDAGKTLTLTPAQYCDELRRPAQRFQAMTGQAMLPLFRAPAGRTSPALLAAAQACGFTHVGWSPAGFLGDELPSDKYPNDQLLAQALQKVKPGDILLAHLGIWSRQDPWAPAVLEPLITGLQARGLCFATLREHPLYGRAAAPAR
ncbi:polysaccharide deacetylase family protein [Aquincola tertiaricarbonis]|uniref:Polysaccharide deacetylase family protein n=1 Tax=Aquincola tertiaricarbonis TaxID=391953 RepID=A0ABY4SEK6_AQUTE|nr:polysaccharide deacetylase family protein [Aquincola tertiaricarbonis]URI11449.1 polysaccharide deacetylase family protein [Aquincola tertiaricarbonis]